MKFTLLAGTALGLFTACQSASAANGYEITGQLRNAPAGTTLHLAEVVNLSSQPVERATATTDAQGRFTFKSAVPAAPGVYQLKVDDANQVLLLLDNQTHLTLAGDAKNLLASYTVRGSQDSEVVRQLTRLTGPVQASMQQLSQRFAANQQAGRNDSLAAIQQQALALQASTARQMKAVVRRNATTRAAGFATLNFFKPADEFAFADSMATVQAKAQPESPYTKELAAKLAPLRRTAIGATAPNINLPTPGGKMLALESLRGQYVLLDFWASWCGPCRRENPNVVAAYNKFKGKKFTIYSVSLDENKDRWTQAITADNLSWPNHVSDLKGWQSAGAAAYGVQSIPASFLLDPQGKIIAKDLRGEELEAKLREVLK